MSSTCLQCEEIFANKQIKLKCCVCSLLWHTECVLGPGLSLNASEKLKQWSCPLCFIPSRKVRQQIIDKKNEPENLAEVLVKLEDLDKKIIPKVESAIKSAIQDQFTNSCTPQMQKWSDLFKKERSETAKVVSEKNSKAIAEAVILTKQRIDSDSLEREKRKCNIVIRDIEESKSTLISEKIEDDKNITIELLNIEQKEIVNIRRAGRVRTDGSNRPLIVTVSTPELANDLHNYGRGSKRTRDSRIFWINPDLIQADRVANYKSRLIARQKKNTHKDKEALNLTPQSIQFLHNPPSRLGTTRRDLPTIPYQSNQTVASPFISELLKKHK